MSIRRKGRDVNGILLLDKPIGYSSNQALTEVKRLFTAKKAGHTGSLDPLACGMLPICFGEATKFSQFLLEADKEYLVTAKLGVRTNTGDAEGQVISTAPVMVIDQTELDRILTNFRGEIAQIPSMYSALKHQGKPLYVYARQGIEVPRLSRKVVIKELSIVDFHQDTLTLQIRCSKGTYIRTLIDDIGQMLKCGAHVIWLRRTYVDPYVDAKMLTIDELKDNQENLDELLLPIDSALMLLPKVNLSDAIIYYVKQGQPVIVPHAPTKGFVRLFYNEQTFVGVGEILADGRVAPRRLIATRFVARTEKTC